MSTNFLLYFNRLDNSNNYSSDEYYNYLVTNNISDSIKLLSLLSSKNNVAPFQVDLKNRLIQDIKAHLTWRGSFNTLIPVYKYAHGGVHIPSWGIYPVINNTFVKNNNELILKCKDNSEIILNVENNNADPIKNHYLEWDLLQQYIK